MGQEEPLLLDGGVHVLEKVVGVRLGVVEHPIKEEEGDIEGSGGVDGVPRHGERGGAGIRSRQS